MNILDSLEKLNQVIDINGSALRFYLMYHVEIESWQEQTQYIKFSIPHPVTNTQIEVKLNINELKLLAFAELMDFSFTEDEVDEYRMFLDKMYQFTTGFSDEKKVKLLELIDKLTIKQTPI